MNQADLEKLKESGAVVTDDPKHTLNVLRQETGPKVVCVLESQTPSGEPLTKDEKDLIKHTMGGRREQQILQGILAKRGGGVTRDWQRLVVKQQIWFE